MTSTYWELFTANHCAGSWKHQDEWITDFVLQSSSSRQQEHWPGTVVSCLLQLGAVMGQKVAQKLNLLKVLLNLVSKAVLKKKTVNLGVNLVFWYLWGKYFKFEIYLWCYTTNYSVSLKWLQRQGSFFSCIPLSSPSIPPGHLLCNINYSCIYRTSKNLVNIF